MAMALLLAAAAFVRFSPAPLPEFASVPGFGFATAPALTGWDDPRLARRDGEDDIAFAARLSNVVHTATYHCDHRERAFSVPALVAARRLESLDPAMLGPVGFLDPSATRCGFCHQRAFLLAEALRNARVSARAWALNGHVVTLLQSGGRTYIADADLGIEPFEIDLDDADPVRRASLIQAAYASFPEVGTVKAEVFSAYATREDDGVYHSMNRLRAASDLQNAELKRAQFQLLAASVVLALLGAGAFAAHWLRRRRLSRSI
jgi:hypothetical protein